MLHWLIKKRVRERKWVLNGKILFILVRQIWGFRKSGVSGVPTLGRIFGNLVGCLVKGNNYNTGSDISKTSLYKGHLSLHNIFNTISHFPPKYWSTMIYLFFSSHLFPTLSHILFLCSYFWILSIRTFRWWLSVHLKLACIK